MSAVIFSNPTETTMAERSKPVDWKRVAALMHGHLNQYEIGSGSAAVYAARGLYRESLKRSRALGRTKKEKEA